MTKEQALELTLNALYSTRDSLNEQLKDTQFEFITGTITEAQPVIALTLRNKNTSEKLLTSIKVENN